MKGAPWPAQLGELGLEKRPLKGIALNRIFYRELQEGDRYYRIVTFSAEERIELARGHFVQEPGAPAHVVCILGQKVMWGLEGIIYIFLFSHRNNVFQPNIGIRNE
jgi:hypothetical protein